MEVFDIILVGIIVCLAGIAQSTVGFGYALFSTPLLVWMGMPLPNVIILVATCSMIQAIVGVRKLKDAVPWRLSIIATVVRIGGVVGGMFLLKRLVFLEPHDIRTVIGGILCLLVLIQVFWRPQPVRTLHWSWALLAFSVSGLSAGICGMGGPPLVLWSIAHDWSTQKTRGFLFSVFSIAIPLQIFLMILAFDVSLLRSVALGLAFSPLVYLGTRLGLPIGNRMEKETLRRLAYVVLLIIGLSSVLPSLCACFK